MIYFRYSIPFYLLLFTGIEIRAQRRIMKGEELTIQYQSLFTGSRKRREMFKRVWYFDCECPRCQDPSELGSYLNAFVCPIDSGKNVNLQNDLIFDILNICVQMYKIVITFKQDIML